MEVSEVRLWKGDPREVFALRRALQQPEAILDALENGIWKRNVAQNPLRVLAAEVKRSLRDYLCSPTVPQERLLEQQMILLQKLTQRVDDFLHCELCGLPLVNAQNVVAYGERRDRLVHDNCHQWATICR
jgi:signal transduction histidine kinase